MYLAGNGKRNQSKLCALATFRYQIRQIRKTMFNQLSIPVYRYTQKLILYHIIQQKYRYFDISIRIAHHYLIHCTVVSLINNNIMMSSN